MNVSKLFRTLLARCYSMGIVEAGGGGGAAADVAELDDPDGGAAAAATAAEGDAAPAEGSGDPEDENEVVVSIGDEQPSSEEEEESRAPSWVRDLRKSNREKDRKLREQEAEIARLKGGGSAPAAAVVVGEEPTLESCDWDGERYGRELKAWYDRKNAAAAEDAKKSEAEQAAKASWQAKLDAYGKSKVEMKVRDFDDAEALAADVLNVTQQGVVINGADNPALVIYALGKNPKKAKELAAISDPVKFAFAIAKLETQLKVTQRKAAPTPERVVRSSVPGAAVVDNQLDRLRAEAEKTGDYTKVHAYKQQQRKAVARA